MFANTSKAVTLWLMSGYSAPLTNEHFTDSVGLAATNVEDFSTDPDHIALNAWLDDITNCIAAVSFMHNYWHIRHNCGKAEDITSRPVMSGQYVLCLMDLVDSISTMP